MMKKQPSLLTYFFMVTKRKDLTNNISRFFKLDKTVLVFFLKITN